MSELPTPRLQLRWEASTPEDLDKLQGYIWKCHYELVILLDEYDIRREVYKDGDMQSEKLPREMKIPMKPPSFRGMGSDFPPCTSGDGKSRFGDMPFRDGAHAMWDAIHLGCLPVVVVAPDGKAWIMKYETDGKKGSYLPIEEQEAT